MNKHLGAALVEARERRGLDQHELAQLLGIRNCMVSKVEGDKRALTATEFMTLGLLFPNWFEMEVADLVTDLRADLAARLREFLAERTFAPLELQKRDWLNGRLTSLDSDTVVDA